MTELSLERGNFGAFVRGSALYDVQIEDNDHRPHAAARAPRRIWSASTSRLLDAFVYARFDLGSMPAELRLGRQVVSWGESTFIQGGLNAINHFDVVGAARAGLGAEGSLPAAGNGGVQPAVQRRCQTQLVYLLDWNDTEPEPAGSYFSTNDFACRGGEQVVLGFGAFSDQGVDFTAARRAAHRGLPERAARLDDRSPDNSGQFGINFKLYLPDFNQGTEFGLYFLNYHSRLPRHLRAAPAPRPASATRSAR